MPERNARESLFEGVRDDLALVNEIPLYTIPDDAEFTLDQHLAFGRLTDYVGPLTQVAEAARELLDDDDMPRHWADCVCSYCTKHRALSNALADLVNALPKRDAA